MRGTVYKASFFDGWVYIGSTTQELNTRLNNHKADNRPLRELFRAFPHVILEELESIEFEDIIELRKLEQDYINKYEKTINKRRAHTSPEESKKYQKEYDKERKKTDKHKEYRKIEVSCRCGVTIKRHHLARHQRSIKCINYFNNTK